MKLPDFLFSEPLALHQPALAGWMQRFGEMSVRLTRADVSAHEDFSVADLINQRRPYKVTPHGFAVIHINDLLCRGSTAVERMLGVTDYNQVIDEIQKASRDATVRGVFLDINSPGGSVVGVSEAAQAIADVRAKKPVVAYIETMGCSAAYFLAAPSTAIVASASAMVGSIGIIATFENIAAMLAQMGISVEFLTPKGADLKAAGNRVRPMTEAERTFLQEHVEAAATEFNAWVRQHRGAIEADTMRGQWFSGKESLARGLVDAVGGRTDAAAALATLAHL